MSAHIPCGYLHSDHVACWQAIHAGLVYRKRGACNCHQCDWLRSHKDACAVPVDMDILCVVHGCEPSFQCGQRRCPHCG